MKKLGIVLVCVLSVLKANAQQDKHFSMFAESPVYMNPATAGFMPGKLQLFTNFRMQWLTVSDNPYRTISAAADTRVLDNGNFMGLGLTFYNDVAGDGQYMINEVTVPINYALEVGKNSHVALGLQFGWYSRTLQSAAFTWDNQWTGASFNTDLPSNEAIFGQNFSSSKFDLSTGFHYYGHVKENVRISLGVAGHHLTKQKINFYSDDDKLFRKLTIHGQAEIKQIGTTLTVYPAFYGFLQGPNMEFTMGSNFRFLLRDASRTTGYFSETALSLGAYYRFGDAVLVNAILDLSGLSIGAGYDINISGMSKATNSVGGFEVFIRYRMKFAKKGLGNPSIH
ncbi:PorP/SprF family type IX secretion system membrane protein [Paracrocinitomix mangrovi]|uniref:PorP/SprF family type IX secretion system membrane protein n=1 Tax=Paracrocinitomix mangrovi TaxID=2862509 RepID=UPI001C8EED06|nr:PorP/SprF family type IX secretion system membrane protein [Paracrocinitomix mangrovi]UKN00915.1 PorP/SprF family type IX secretion system membrane protein [Paracrocinitomix mangrovi]